eukprot:5580538-Prymnesium_polylepis.2
MPTATLACPGHGPRCPGHGPRRRKMDPGRASPVALFLAFVLATSHIRSALQTIEAERSLLVAKDPLTK